MPYTEQEIRVMQVIDSLSIGGAERMAVNLANALAEQSHVCSFLCVTRHEGPLAKGISDKVRVLYLHRKSRFDLAAIFKMRKYLRQHRVHLLHAHSTSLFFSALAAVGLPVKVLWHDHNLLQNWPQFWLKLFTFRAPYVFVVNQLLKKWAVEFLDLPERKVIYLPNFPASDETLAKGQALPGKFPEKLKIVCLANLRFPKDHLTLLKAFDRVRDLAVLYLVGTENEDDYAKSLRLFVQQHGMEEDVFFLGSSEDVPNILDQCQIGVLSSESEGLPVALLEYGQAALAVVCTDVGECAAVLEKGKHGLLVPPKNSDELARALQMLVTSEKLRKDLALTFQQHVQTHYSKENTIQILMRTYQCM